MAQHDSLSMIVNPLITTKQLVAHQRRGLRSSTIDTLTFRISLLTQSAGILLRLPQEIIATTIILLQRYLTTDTSADWLDGTNESGTKFAPDAYLTRASSAATYLAAKSSFYPLNPRSIINVYALLTSPNFPLTNQLTSQSSESPDPRTYYVSEGTYATLRATLFTTERHILTLLSFSTRAALPYSLALTYLRALSAATPTLSERVLAHLNAALLSPQLLYLTHQPNEVAVAAIYLAARELGVPLVDGEMAWWDVFDVDREALGFLVLGLGSLDGFVGGLGQD